MKKKIQEGGQYLLCLDITKKRKLKLVNLTKSTNETLFSLQVPNIFYFHTVIQHLLYRKCNIYGSNKNIVVFHYSTHKKKLRQENARPNYILKLWSNSRVQNGFRQKKETPTLSTSCKWIYTVCKMPLSFFLLGRATISFSTCLSKGYSG